MIFSRRILTAIALIVLLSSAGCIEIEINTKIKEDGSGTQVWRFIGSALLASDIKKQFERNRFFGKSITRDQYKEGDYILESTLNFHNISELRNADRDVRFSTEGWIVKTHTYTEVWKRSGEAAGFLAQHAGGLAPVTLKISVELPGTIVESNADSKEGGIARWSMPVSDLVSSKKLVAKSRSWNWPLLIVAGTILLGIFGVLLFLVYSNVQKSQSPPIPTVLCAACGAKVSSGSTFCNFCGNKM
jgi:hypothetical protein